MIFGENTLYNVVQYRVILYRIITGKLRWGGTTGGHVAQPPSKQGPLQPAAQGLVCLSWTSPRVEASQPPRAASCDAWQLRASAGVWCGVVGAPRYNLGLEKGWERCSPTAPCQPCRDWLGHRVACMVGFKGLIAFRKEVSEDTVTFFLYFSLSRAVCSWTAAGSQQELWERQFRCSIRACCGFVCCG